MLFTVNTLSCKKDMEQQVIEKQLPRFDTLTLNSAFTVYLTQGTQNSIKLVGAKVVLDKISMDITNYKLILLNNYKEKWLHPNHNKVIVYITTNKLNRIDANATCSIHTTNTLIEDYFGLSTAGKLNEATIDVKCNYFYFWNNPPSGGRITLSGSAKKMKLENNALMEIDAHDFDCNIVRVANLSKGDVKVIGHDSLIYSITNTGNIYLSGNTAGTGIINLGESSTGKLIIEP